jgi:hypothetical protein
VTLRAAARLVLLSWSLGTVALTAWVFAQNPFATVIVERSAVEARQAMEMALARKVDADWLAPRLRTAIEREDVDDIGVLLRLAEQQEIALDPALSSEAARLAAEARGIAACGSCAWDTANCVDLAQLALCNLAIEVTPLGDLNAIRRGLGDYLAGNPVDRVDLGLGLVGATATGALLASGGTSAPVKAGASLLRVARRAGGLSPGLRSAVDDAVTGAVRWEDAGRVASGRVAPSAMVDTLRTGRLSAIARDAARLTWNTTPGDGLALLRLADDPAELAGLARLSDATGGATRPTLRALGKTRALRSLGRVSELAIAAMGLVSLLVAQLGAFAVMLARRGLRLR